MKKKVSLLMVTAMSIAILCGCGNKENYTTTSESYDNTSEIAEEEETDKKVTPKEHVSEDQPDKSETVYVNTDASGNVTDTSVTVTLKNPGGLDEIADISNLTNIRNTDGNEEFTADGENISWENLGEDITYKGDSQEEAPVSVKITYYLDEEEISPEDLAHKAGHVKIRFDYTNNTEDYIPFVCATIIPLDSDDFYNVTAEDGNVKYTDGYVMPVGIAIPGIYDALHMDSNELFDEDTEVKDYFEVEMDTDDFSLEYTETIVMNGIFSDLEEDTLEDLSDSAEDLKDAGDASDELSDGIDQLIDGVTEYKDAIKDYTDGVDSCTDGAKQLYKGLKALNQYSAYLPEEMAASVKQLTSGAKSLYSGLNKLSGYSDDINEGADSLLSGSKDLKKGVKTLSEEALDKMVDLGNEIDELTDDIETLKKNDKTYTNFSGIIEGGKGEVTFMIESEEID